MCGADAGHHKRPCPSGPFLHKVFMAEVAVKLIKYHALPGGLRRDVLCAHERVLPCPADFDQVIFLAEAHAERGSIARALVDDDLRGDARDRRCSIGKLMLVRYPMNGVRSK